VTRFERHIHGRFVLFDVDGTIAETEGEGHLPAFNGAFKEFSIPWEWSLVQYGKLLEITGGFERMLAYARSVGDPIGATEAGQEQLRRVHRRKNELYAERLARGLIPPRAGLIELLEMIARHQGQWAVVTTTSQANWHGLWTHCIARSGNVSPPRFAICGEDVRQKKPNPEAYRCALARLGVSADQCVAIEDSENGLRAACSAGIDTIVVRSQFFGHQAFSDACLVVDELSDLTR